MTRAADYRELIDNISNFKSLFEKHYAPGTTYDCRRVKMCPACGTAHDRNSQFCSFACSAIFKDIIIPKINAIIYDAERSTKDPLSYQEPINTTTWCGKGSVIYEDEQHSKVECLDLSCDCHYPLLKTSTTYYTCIICNSYFRSFRNPIVCSVACALEFNKITKPPLRQRHHLIQDRLTEAYNEFNYAYIISPGAPSESEFLVQTPFQITPTQLIKNIEANPSRSSKHKPAPDRISRKLNHLSKNTFILQQIILFQPDNPDYRKQPLVTIPELHNSYGQIIVAPPKPPVPGTITYAYHISISLSHNNSNFFTHHPDYGTAIAWRILYETPPLVLFKQYKATIAAHLSSFPKLPHHTYIIDENNPDDLFHIFELIDQLMNRKIIPKHTNKPFHVPHKLYRSYLPTHAPSYTPSGVKSLPITHTRQPRSHKTT